ncbi:hypothetical protein [Novilysobacter selenitireducens]|uniref:DUF4229 domain-containing protein n=1 Tax=Novilysobacter selenitireducens TaxID=2872639 RepID=A0ABS7T6V8_9GAMM|nr:hypothetical protein [Lysobacter selenitireducens]MBZ4039626.1 hypothetical protein [Lysobacter selenitireducens]
MLLAGKFAATCWAAASGALFLASWVLLDANMIFALVALGLSAGCACLALACLLKPSRRTIARRAARERQAQAAAEGRVEDAPPSRHWR